MPGFTHAPLEPMDLTQETLSGAVVYGMDEFVIGRISRLHDLGHEVEVIVQYADAMRGQIRPIALPASEMDFLRDDDGNVFATIERSRDEIAASPLHLD